MEPTAYNSQTLVSATKLLRFERWGKLGDKAGSSQERLTNTFSNRKGVSLCFWQGIPHLYHRIKHQKECHAHPEQAKLKHDLGLDGNCECALVVETSLYNGR